MIYQLLEVVYFQHFPFLEFRQIADALHEVVRRNGSNIGAELDFKSGKVPAGSVQRRYLQFLEFKNEGKAGYRFGDCLYPLSRFGPENEAARQ